MGRLTCNWISLVFSCPSFWSMTFLCQYMIFFSKFLVCQPKSFSHFLMPARECSQLGSGGWLGNVHLRSQFNVRVRMSENHLQNREKWPERKYLWVASQSLQYRMRTLKDLSQDNSRMPQVWCLACCMKCAWRAVSHGRSNPSSAGPWKWLAMALSAFAAIPSPADIQQCVLPRVPVCSACALWDLLALLNADLKSQEC